MSVERRGYHAGPLPDGWVEGYRGHEYGPPIPPNPWPRVTVGHPQSARGEVDVYVDPSVVKQRRQMSAIAYLGDLWPELCGRGVVDAG